MEGAPRRRSLIPGRRRRPRGRSAGVHRLLLGQRSLSLDLPEYGPLRARGDRDDGRPAARGERGRRDLVRRHGEQPARRQVGPRPGQGAPARGHRARDRRTRVRPSVLPEGGRLLRARARIDAADPGRPCRRPGLPRRRHRQHCADGRIGPQHRSRHGGPHPGDGGPGGAARHQLPRRRLCRWLLPAVHREAGVRRHTLGLPRARRDYDLGRPAQVRLYGQGRLGDTVPRSRHLSSTRSSTSGRRSGPRATTSRPPSPAAVPEGPSPPRGPCSDIWARKGTSGWSKGRCAT